MTKIKIYDLLSDLLHYSIIDQEIQNFICGVLITISFNFVIPHTLVYISGTVVKNAALQAGGPWFECPL